MVPAGGARHVVGSILVGPLVTHPRIRSCINLGEVVSSILAIPLFLFAPRRGGRQRARPARRKPPSAVTFLRSVLHGCRLSPWTLPSSGAAISWFSSTLCSTTAPFISLPPTVAKSCDDTLHQGFIDSMTAVGFPPSDIRLIAALQSHFSCFARTPGGPTAPFPVDKGCKQGRALSLARFALLLGMFVQYAHRVVPLAVFKVTVSLVPSGGCPMPDAPRLSPDPAGGRSLHICVLGYIDDLNFITNTRVDLKFLADRFVAFLSVSSPSFQLTACSSLADGERERVLRCCGRPGLRIAASLS